MENPSNILYVTNGLDGCGALKHAVNLARQSRAHLHALIVCPKLPEAMLAYQEVYEDSLQRGVLDCLDSYRKDHGLELPDLDVPIEVESGPPPVMQVVRRTLERKHDLLIKEAQPSPDGKGSKAVDMVLVRKCQCPVWLHRSSARSNEDLRVAVAIDPESLDAMGHELSLLLLRFARTIADHYSGKLDIISCWDYPFEDYLRINAWYRVEDSELSKIVRNVQNKHRAALNALIAESGISGPMRICHTRGQPEQAIPKEVERSEIDLLVIGTMARTGLQGLITGNTSEDILGELRCSVVALKPPGFVSPISF